MNIRSISLVVVAMTSFAALSVLNTSDAQAQRRPRFGGVRANVVVPERMQTSAEDTGRMRVQAAPAAPARIGNEVSGTGSATVGSGARGVNQTFSVKADGTATSPTTTSNSSKAELIRIPGGSTPTPVPVTTFSTVAEQKNTAGTVSGDGKSTSTINAEFNPATQTGRVTATNETNANLTGATGGQATSTGGASLDSSTGLGGATGSFIYKGGN